MLRLFLKNRVIRKSKLSMRLLYKKLVVCSDSFNMNSPSAFNSHVYLSIPKRQQIFNFYDISKNLFFGFTSGIYLKKMGRKAKFFKRDPKNMMVIILQLKKQYRNFLKYIYLFYIKNFSYRQYTFFKKFISIVNPTIYYLVHKQSFMPRFLNKRRIKRRILRRLKKLG